jgi:ornithine carbamoyltransferase
MKPKQCISRDARVLEGASMPRHFLSVSDLGTEGLTALVDQTLALAGSNRGQPRLAGKIVGVFFKRPSTRTRSAFTVGALKLGAQVVTYGPNDLQLVTGETIEDTAAVLSGFLDVLVIRTNEPQSEMVAFTRQQSMSVINAMSADEHPTQVIGDLAAIKEATGRLTDLHVLYVGEGNNTAVALALALAQLPGLRLTLACPRGYGLRDAVLRRAERLAATFGACIEQHDDLSGLPRQVDVVYTTRWCTLGATKQDLDWRPRFAPFSVTSTLMAQVSKQEGTIFLHDLPAVRGEEVTSDVLAGPQSRAFRQAQFKLFGAMAVLQSCAGAVSGRGLD